MMFIVVGLFAIMGALLRDGVGVLTTHWFTGLFPFATLIVNLAGCFVLGWFTTHIRKLKQVHPYIKTGFGTGFVGSFTTFSTFSVDTVRLFESVHILLALVYLFFSYVGGLTMAYLGYQLGEFLMVRRGGESQ